MTRIQAREVEAFFIAASLAVGFITTELPGQRKGPPFDAFFAFRRDALDGKVDWNNTGVGKLTRDSPYSLDNYVEWCRRQQNILWEMERINANLKKSTHR